MSEPVYPDLDKFIGICRSSLALRFHPTPCADLYLCLDALKAQYELVHRFIGAQSGAESDKLFRELVASSADLHRHNDKMQEWGFGG